MEKAPDAFRTISEVAEEINVPQHVLRFWESRFAQIRPMKRGGGRRYYRPDDVALLRGVRHLLYGEGYTIRGVQRILREEGVAFVQRVWRVANEPSPSTSEEEGTDAESRATAGQEDPPVLDFLRAEPTVPKEPAVERRAPALPPLPKVPAPRPGLKDEDRSKLQGVLDDLIACRRLIDAALAQDYAEDGERS